MSYKLISFEKLPDGRRKELYKELVTGKIKEIIYNPDDLNVYPDGYIESALQADDEATNAQK